MLKAIKNVTVILLIVKIIGFIKQSVIAAYFGANGATDTYMLVSELIESMGEVLFSSISVAFLAMYSDIKNNDKNKLSQFTSNTLLMGIPVAVAISLAVFVFSDYIAKLIAPGYSSEELAVVIRYLKILSFGVVCMFVSSLCRAILDAEKHFLPSKFEGIIKSIITILGCVLFGVTKGIDVLIVCILVYYVIADLYLLFCVFRSTDLKIKKPLKDRRLVNLLTLSIPLFISNGSVYLHNIVDKAVGSSLEEGSISVLSYSSYLTNTIHSLIIGSICTVVFSYFCDFIAKKEYELLKTNAQKYIRIAVLVITYIVVMAVICSEEIIQIVYGRGQFDQTAVLITSNVLIIYSIGLIFMAARDILIRVHYAYKDTKTTMINGVSGMLINICLSIILAKFWGVYGIAVATTVSNGIIMLLSFITVKKYVNITTMRNVIYFIFPVLITFFIVFICGRLIDMFMGTYGEIFSLIVKGFIGTALYIGVLYVCKSQDILLGIKYLKSKYNKD